MKRIKIVTIFIILIMGICFFGSRYTRANEISLKSFDILTTQLYQGDKLYYNIDYTSDISFIGIGAKEVSTGEPFYISTSDLSKGYFDLANKNGNTHSGVGTFKLTSVTIGKKEGVEFYSINECGDNSGCIKYDFNDIEFTIKEKENNTVGIFDYVMTMDFQTVYVGEKVSVNFGSPKEFNGKEIDEKPLSNVMLSFSNQSNGEVLNVYLNSLDNNPYFIVPSTASAGKYSINYGYLTFTDGTSQKYQNNDEKVFSYESTFEVMEGKINNDSYSFNSEDYNGRVKEEITALDDDAIITINANNFSIIYKEIFELIKDTNKTLVINYQNIRWVFNGKDIKNPKTIEVSVKLGKLGDDIKISDDNIKDNAILLEFNNNGELPGKALIKIDSNDVLEYFDSEVMYVYYYNEDGTILKVAMEIKKNNGFFEFYINHNSKYILTKNEIKKDIVLASDNILKDNTKNEILKSNTTLYILLGVGVLIIVVISIILIKRRKKVRKG